MFHAGVAEAAYHLNEGVGVGDEGEECVAEPLALSRAARKPRKVHKLHLRGRLFARRVDPYKLVETFVGNGDDGLIWVGLPSRVRLYLRSGPCYHVKYCRLSAQRQSNNPTMQHLYQLHIFYYYTSLQEFTIIEWRGQLTVVFYFIYKP